MSNNNSSSSGGVGFFGLMFLIFMTLKLTNYIDWSWWWVTAPLWGGFALIFLFVMIVAFIKMFD
jgi:hypothetical protein